MDRQSAERLATTSVVGVSVAEVRLIVDEFLRQLALCPACDGTGELSIGRDMVLEVETSRYGHVSAPGTSQYVAKGTVASCPRCGGRDEDGRIGGDPAHVSWHCTEGDGERQCANAQGVETRRSAHQRCGFRLVLDLPSATSSEPE